MKDKVPSAKTLKLRWKGEERRIAAIIKDLKEGRDWTVNLGSCESSGWRELEHVRTCTAPALGGKSLPRDLRGLQLRDVDLSECQGLADAYLDYADISGVALVRASLIGTSLRHARFSGGSMLDYANLSRSDLRGSRFEDASLVKADLTGAKLHGAYFDEVDLSRCRFREVTYSTETSLGFLRPRAWTSFGGRCRNAKRISTDSDQEFRRYLLGDVAVNISRKMHPGLAKLWYLLSNFGRSPGRLLLWIILVWFIFGCLYSGFGLFGFLADTAIGDFLVRCAPKMKFGDCLDNPCHLFQPFYFSVTTLTTLGFGDVVPSAHDWKAQLYVFCEALFGFVFLGAYVSLLLQNSIAARE